MCRKGFQMPDSDKNKEQFRCIRKIDFKVQTDRVNGVTMINTTTKPQNFMHCV